MPIAFPQIPRGRPEIWGKSLNFNPSIVQVNPNLPNLNFKFSIETMDGGPGKIYPKANPAALKISIGKRFIQHDNEPRPQPLTDARLKLENDGRSTMVLTGVSRDSTGAALGTCIVKLFRTVDDVLIAQTTSDGSGNYSFILPPSGPYYLVEYKDGGTPVAGTSLNTLTPVPA